MRGSLLVWVAMAAAAALGWYLTAVSLTYRFGPDEAAPAVGVLVAVAVGLTVWRWGRQDRVARALAAGACPRCAAPIAVEHEHAGARPDGVTRWTCPACGYEHAERLTCEQCRP